MPTTTTTTTTRHCCEPGAAAPREPELVGRRVFCPRHMSGWESSEALADVLEFVDRMNAAAAAGHADSGRAQRERDAATGIADGTAEVLRHVGEWATELQSFDDFHEALRARGRVLLSRVFGRDGSRDHRVAELPAYLETSFGDPANTAYGPEHELSFSMFLMALFKLGRLTYRDGPYAVNVLFDRYLDIVDHLIRSFRLVPSSSHGGGSGNPGVDDYRFLGFVWGSAQLMGRGSGPSPATAVMANADGSLSDKRMFAKCVDAVHRRESDRGGGGGGRPPRPLWWHSYRLWNLTASGSWDLVNRRLMAAYRRDVLRRFGVVRHLVFGQLFRFAPNPRPRRPSASGHPAAATPTDRTVDDDDEGRGKSYEYDDDRSIGTGLHEAVE